MGGTTVYDLSGNRIGSTTQPVEDFLDDLADAISAGDCYVMVSDRQVPADFVAALRKFVPVVADPALAAGRMEIWQGVP